MSAPIVLPLFIVFVEVVQVSPILPRGQHDDCGDKQNNANSHSGTSWARRLFTKDGGWNAELYGYCAMAVRSSSMDEILIEVEATPFAPNSVPHRKMLYSLAVQRHFLSTPSLGQSSRMKSRCRRAKPERSTVCVRSGSTPQFRIASFHSGP